MAVAARGRTLAGDPSPSLSILRPRLTDSLTADHILCHPETAEH
jgi:hypothetical protein